MQRMRPTIVATVMGLTIAAAAPAAEPGPAPRRNPVVVPEGPWKATDLEAASGDPARIRAAIAAYQAAPDALDNPGVMWRLTKAWFHLYDELPRQFKDERVHAAEQSAQIGERAAAMAPEDMAVKYWYSQGLLGLADMKGAVTFLSKLKEIKALVNEVRTREPGIDDAGPDRFFAIYYHELPWPFKDTEASFRHAEAAWGRAAYRCVNVYLYARGLIDRDREEEARPLVRELTGQECTASSAMWSDIYRGYGAELEERL